MPDATAPGEVPALGISYKVIVAQNRELVFQTHVAADSDPTTINRLLDLLARAADRQQAYYELEGLRTEKDRQYAALQRAVQDRGRLDARHEHAAAQLSDSGRRKPYEIPQKEKEAREAALINEKVFKDEIVRYDQEIAKREALLKG